MVEKFHEELKELKKDVLTMGYLARDMLLKSIATLNSQDPERAEWVLSKKEELARWDAKIEEKALKLLTLYQPMAGDLRTIAASLKIITYLNRLGRYGKDIAKIVPELSKQPHIAKLVSIPHMAEILSKMIEDALKAYETDDKSLLQDFSERDDTLDALRYSIFRESLTYMMEDQKNITRCAHYMMIARFLERCGDNACKIAEKVHYMVTGEHIEIK
jgi:phosphate transport system protein